MVEILSCMGTLILSYVDDYMEPMAIFTMWMEINSTKYNAIARVASIGWTKFLSSKNFCYSYGTYTFLKISTINYDQYHKKCYELMHVSITLYIILIYIIAI